MVFHNYEIKVSQLLKTLSLKEVRRECETQSKKERGRHGCLELGESEGSVRGLENVRLVCFHLDFIESQLVSNLCTVRCQVD